MKKRERRKEGKNTHVCIYMYIYFYVLKEEKKRLTQLCYKENVPMGSG